MDTNFFNHEEHEIQEEHEKICFNKMIVAFAIFLRFAVHLFFCSTLRAI